MSKKRILIGAHVSIAGGLNNAIPIGESIDCTAIQIFTKNSRSWFVKKLSDEEINQFKIAWKKSTIETIIAHTSYLINIASKNPDTEKKSVKSLEGEIELCENLGIPYLVLHPGSHLGLGEEAGIKKIATNLDKILEKTTDKTMILLESMAGQGTNLGYKFEQLKEIRDLCKEKKKIGVCIDSCHMFSAGYDFGSPEGYKKIFHNFDKTIGLENLKAIHLNDSKTPLGSRLDRHENIGHGTIPLNFFKLIMNDKRFSDIPKILETPVKDISEYKEQIYLLKNMVE